MLAPSGKGLWEPARAPEGPSIDTIASAEARRIPDWSLPLSNAEDTSFPAANDFNAEGLEL